ncbi:hypothetical protein [Massilia horti]|uniref:Uncharacterized protein n=1 Tax=Massilia horti TaxID=2562153 RepID=A0A4Y9T6M7_9BURK|nr:hypothetical protein [Massilia horti]TFW32915.1 hypothetical protein E4O92_08295 [Massilia horti]
MKLLKSLLLCASLACASAQAAPAAPDLDLGISYYTRVVTDEGVTREIRYEERMVRRAGHVWLERVLPQRASLEERGHKHFNPVRLARHVMLENGKLKLEYVDVHGRERVAIPPSEFENVDFNGSWDRSFYLAPPKLIAGMPLSSRPSNMPGARWREREKNGRFERVLWDDVRQVALIIEAGDRAGHEFQRVEARLLARPATAAPWTKLAGFSQKEYADFLD